MNSFSKLITSLLCLAAVLVAVPADAKTRKAEQPQVKYVFYMIGDGMGINEVIGAQEYNEATGKGPAVINFTQFPVRGFITTHSGSSLVTDSAAGATALSSGVKTYNGAIGLDMDQQPVSLITEWAKESGFGTGIATNVGINHATPAGFSTHTAQRGNYEDIAGQLIRSKVDFAAGGGFLTERGTGHDNNYFINEARNAGINVFRGPDFKGVAAAEGRVICLSGKDQTDLPYMIDRQEGDTALSDFVEAGISYLDAKFGKKGFFFMIEGGKIDGGGHANDAAVCFQEVTDFANAIDVVLAFYDKHPDETLIVITADHETGGLMLGAGLYEMHPDRMTKQNMSVDALTAKFREAFLPARPQGEARPPFNPETPAYTPPTWEQVKDFFREHLGLWGEVEVDQRSEAALKGTYERTFGKDGDRENNVANLYSVNARLVAEAVNYLDRTSGFSWGFGSHSGSPVGLYVKGRTAGTFATVRDNAEIAPTIAKLAGYKK